MEYRALTECDFTKDLLRNFIRRQTVEKCRRKHGQTWTLENIAFEEDWSEEDKARKLREMRENAESGGCTFGAWHDGILKGFIMLENMPMGSHKQYLQVSSLHVSRDMRRMGIGKQLFRMGKAWAKARGAEKLYISACSAEETMAFYQAMGCVEAEEYDAEAVAKEPCDCQIECPL